ncbi:hypothetical protein J2046_004051 [Rhizobium petrolearium]|nr:hypothetical protein [Neorhizobium petrolearium]
MRTGQTQGDYITVRVANGARAAFVEATPNALSIAVFLHQG